MVWDQTRRARLAALLASASFIIIAADAGRAAAQVRAGEAAPAQDDAAFNVGEVVVTAQRRSELSRDVPIAITSLSRDQLEQADVQQLSDIAKLAPNVRLRGDTSFVQPSIRGVSTSLVGSGVGSNVGIYVDGFYSTTATGSNLELLNVESLQVLKGPQGTLFGRNTTGGAILVTTARPSTTTRGAVEAAYERFDAQRYRGYFTTGLAEGLAVDIEGLYRSGDGYFKNIVRGGREGGYENWTARAGLSWTPSDKLSFLLRYQHNHTDDPTNFEANAVVQDGRPLTVGAVIPGVTVATRPGEVATTAEQPVSFKSKSDAVQLTAEADLGFAKLTSYSQYRKEKSESFSDLDYSAAPVFYLHLPQSVEMVTQELLLVSKPGPALQWTAGAFFLDQKDSFPRSEASAGAGPFLLIASTGLRTRSLAVYGDATYEVTPDLFLTAGLRWTRERSFDAFRNSGPLSGGLGLTSYAPMEKDYFTPRVVIRYKPTTSSSVYASITRGSKAGIIDTNDSSPDAVIKPEKLTAYEVGYKYGARAVTLDLAAYYYDYKNLQVSIPVGTALLVRNAADSRIYGAEAQLRYIFGGGFELSAGAGYNNAKYRNFPNSQVFEQCLDPACGPAFGLFPVATADASGFHMQMAPEFSANLNPSYARELAGGSLRLNANLAYTSSFYFDTSEQFRQSPYATLDLRAEWTDPSDRYTFAVYGKNVTAKRYQLQVTPNTFGVGAVWSAPAVYGGSVRARF